MAKGEAPLSDLDTRHYRRLPYRRRAQPVDEQDGSYFIAFIEEIPWIRAHGDSASEALYNLDQSFDDCIAAMLTAGDPIPEPEIWPGPPEEPRAHAQKVRWRSVVSGGITYEPLPADTGPFQSPAQEAVPVNV